MGKLFHVTSSLNRKSIQRYGLDWQRMSAARGIAGSREPEQEGCFLCRSEWDVDWFVEMNNTGGPVDVWGVEGVDVNDLVLSPENYEFFPGVIPPERLSLHRHDIPPLTDEERFGSATEQGTGVSLTFKPRT